MLPRRRSYPAMPQSVPEPSELHTIVNCTGPAAALALSLNRTRRWIMSANATGSGVTASCGVGCALHWVNRKPAIPLLPATD